MNRTRVKSIHLPRQSIHKGALILVNAAAAVSTASPPHPFLEVAPGVTLEKQTAAMYRYAVRAVGGAEEIVPVSGYRSQAQQQNIFAGAAKANGKTYAETYVALPGHSEHQTGLAIDVALRAPEIDFNTPHFPYSGICQAFRLAAVQSGFIQRYPKGKEHITGIGHEPWHFRYVGIPHSLLITSHNFTLEEYVQWIKAFPYPERPYRFNAGNDVYQIGYIPAAGPNHTEVAVGQAPYTISGNNIDGYIITVWGGSCEKG